MEDYQIVLKIEEILFPGRVTGSVVPIVIIEQIKALKQDSQAYQELRHSQLTATPAPQNTILNLEHEMYSLLPGDEVKAESGTYRFLRYIGSNTANLMDDRDGFDFHITIDELIRAFKISQKIEGTEYNQMNNYKPCPKCGDPTYQDINDLSYPFCSITCNTKTQTTLNSADEQEANTIHPFSAKLKSVLDSIYSMLMDKNKAYGDSALNPIGIFAQGNPEDLIRVRIDDKITRIKNLNGKDTEDPEMDLTGYLILLLISRGWSYTSK